MSQSIRFAMVAGEASGDNLGANLIQSLKKIYPNATFEGVGGSNMKAQGFHSMFDMDRLSVLGFIEPLKRLPELICMRRQLKKHFIQHRPDVFISIDSPDFNLGLALQLKKRGIKTVHYVSPSVWAWRQGRIKGIKKSVDLMLTLFPFETQIYQKNDIPFCHVGHSLADSIPLNVDKSAARQKLEIDSQGKIVALLPGSRSQEIKYLLPEFIAAAKCLLKKDKTVQFIMACSNPQRFKECQELVSKSELPIRLYLNQSFEVMAASDAILVASGTATLEAMLIKRPTVVAYKVSPWTFFLAKKLIKVPFIALPNLLANKLVMTEYIQDQIQPERIANELNLLLSQPNIFEPMLDTFKQLHLELRKNAGQSAANAISKIV